MSIASVASPCLREVAHANDRFLGEERRPVGPHDGGERLLQPALRLRDGEKERDRVVRDPPLARLEVELERLLGVLVRGVGADEVRRLELADDEVVDGLEARLELLLLRRREVERFWTTCTMSSSAVRRRSTTLTTNGALQDRRCTAAGSTRGCRGPRRWDRPPARRRAWLRPSAGTARRAGRTAPWP